jgi:hypothetical protein
MNCVGDQCDCNDIDGPTSNNCTDITYLDASGHAVRFEVDPATIPVTYVDPLIGGGTHAADTVQPKIWDANLATNVDFSGNCWAPSTTVSPQALTSTDSSSGSSTGWIIPVAVVLGVVGVAALTVAALAHKKRVARLSMVPVEPPRVNGGTSSHANAASTTSHV